jgi:hypothetical protein
MTAIRIGDPVTGRNRYTDEQIRGEVVEISTGFDGLEYATVKQYGIKEDRPVRLDDLRGPRTCYSPKANEPWDGRCARCGRLIYVNGPYDAESYTHDLSRVPGRYH